MKCEVPRYRLDPEDNFLEELENDDSYIARVAKEALRGGKEAFLRETERLGDLCHEPIFYYRLALIAEKRYYEHRDPAGLKRLAEFVYKACFGGKISCIKTLDLVERLSNVADSLEELCNAFNASIIFGGNDKALLEKALEVFEKLSKRLYSDKSAYSRNNCSYLLFMMITRVIPSLEDRAEYIARLRKIIAEAARRSSEPYKIPKPPLLRLSLDAARELMTRGKADEALKILKELIEYLVVVRDYYLAKRGFVYKPFMILFLEALNLAGGAYIIHKADHEKAIEVLRLLEDHLEELLIKRDERTSKLLATYLFLLSAAYHRLGKEKKAKRYLKLFYELYSSLK